MKVSRQTTSFPARHHEGVEVHSIDITVCSVDLAIEQMAGIAIHLPTDVLGQQAPGIRKQPLVLHPMASAEAPASRAYLANLMSSSSLWTRSILSAEKPKHVDSGQSFQFLLFIINYLN